MALQTVPKEQPKQEISKVDQLRHEIETATSLQTVKEIRDQLATLQSYVKSSGRGREQMNDIAEGRVRAEWKGGKLLREIERGEPGRPKANWVQAAPNFTPYQAAIKEAGLSTDTAKRWQVMSYLPEEDLDEYFARQRHKGRDITSAGVYDLGKKWLKEHSQQEYIEIGEEETTDLDEDNFLVGDFRDVIPTLEKHSVDHIITDPPYKDEYIPLYGPLAEYAAHVLKPGGSLLVMTGQLYLPKILSLMTAHPPVRYHWMLAYLTPGGQSPQIWPCKVNTFWKPILWFINGEYTDDTWRGDVLKSAVNDNDKQFHEWGQSESGMTDIIERFTKPGDLILDPFLGGGTTGVVAHMLNRRFVGIDKDEEKVKLTRGRIARALQQQSSEGEEENL